jgi:hypothetical protein
MRISCNWLFFPKINYTIKSALQFSSALEICRTIHDMLNGFDSCQIKISDEAITITASQKFNPIRRRPYYATFIISVSKIESGSNWVVTLRVPVWCKLIWHSLMGLLVILIFIPTNVGGFDYEFAIYVLPMLGLPWLFVQIENFFLSNRLKKALELIPGDGVDS